MALELDGPDLCDGQDAAPDDAEEDGAAEGDQATKGRAARGRGRGAGGGAASVKQNILKGTAARDKGSKSNARQCRGCKTFFGPEGIALGKNYCHADNRALDNIRYCAVKQNKLDWYQRMRIDDSKCAHTLAEYHKRFPDAGGEATGSGQKRKKTPTTVTYQLLENIIASTKVLRATEGEMMWEKEYIEFAQSKSGGALTDDSARAQWDKWKSALASELAGGSDPGGERSGLLHDQGGPEWSTLRFWVKTKDKIVYEESVEKQKVLKCADKELKNLDPSSVDSLHKKLYSDHDKIGRASEAQDLQDMARSMVQHSGGAASALGQTTFDSGFWGKAMDIPEVEGLASF